MNAGKMSTYSMQVSDQPELNEPGWKSDRPGHQCALLVKPVILLSWTPGYRAGREPQK